MFAALVVHTIYPGSPPGSLSYASPAKLPISFVKRHEETVVPVAVTFVALIAVEVAKRFVVNDFAGF
jgi:hypothetical protein